MASNPEIVDGTTGEVIVATPPDALTEFGQDQFGIERAKAVANQLDSIIREKGLAVNIQGNEHLRVEAWCACASLCGVSPRTEWTRRVPEEGAIEGYVARVEVVQIATGQVIGAAEAGCFADEEEYSRKSKEWYQRWVKHDKPVQHAILSMAQTRATSKAIGQVLRFIPVLAGYAGTPAEEMPRSGEQDQGMPPQPKAQKPVPDPRRKKATDAQKKMLMAVSYKRAGEVMDICVDKDRPLRHQDNDSLSASIRKHAMIAVGVAAIDELKFDEVDPLKDAIERAETDPEGDVVIPESKF